ncbi:MAG: hypothetical protein WA666_03085 [Nitrospirota bacterium]
MRKQACVKVKAWVDERVAPLVEALSKINGLMTFESCEEWTPNEAVVLFTFGASTKKEKLVSFCGKLSEILRDLDCGVVISLEWRGSNDQPWGRLAVTPDHITDIARTIERSF